MIDERTEIHPSAKIAEDVEIGPWTVIGPQVEIDSGTTIGSHVVINGYTKIGKNNRIFQFASLGDEPQDLTYNNEETILEIGDENIIREFCMLSRGSAKDDGITRIGNKNYFMAYSHVGHDCKVGNEVTMTNYAALSGHVQVGDYAVIGAYAGIHQFCQIGEYSFIGRASYVSKDVLPYVMISGQTVSACGLNTVGLKRRGFSQDDIDCLRKAYKIIFRRGLTVQQALVELIEISPDSDKVHPLIKALKASTRGIVR